MRRFSRAVEVSAKGSWGRTALHPAITLCLYRVTTRYAAVRFRRAGVGVGTVAARWGGAGALHRET